MGLLALILISCLLLNLTSAQRSASIKTNKNCRGSSSRPSSSRGSTRGRAQQGVGQMLNQQLGPRLQLLQKQLRQPQEGQQKNFQQKNQEDKQQELVPDRAQVLHPQKLLAHLESLGESYPKRKKTKQPLERQILVFLQLMWTAILFLPLMRKGIQFLPMMRKGILFPLLRELKLQRRNI